MNILVLSILNFTIFALKQNLKNMNTLSEIGNIPVDFAILKSMYPDHNQYITKLVNWKSPVYLSDSRKVCMWFRLRKAGNYYLWNL